MHTSIFVSAIRIFLLYLHYKVAKENNTERQQEANVYAQKAQLCKWKAHQISLYAKWPWTFNFQGHPRSSSEKTVYSFLCI